MGNLFKRIKDKLTGDDDEQQDERKEERREEQPQQSEARGEASGSVGGSTYSPGATTASADTLQDIVNRAESSRQSGGGSSGGGGSGASAEAATAATSSEGAISGSGLDRTYTTRHGDTLEAIAAYFYGDPVHKQRLFDDNEGLQQWEGQSMPSGIRIKVGEDVNRGDAVSS